jgi:hypothetical protein
MDKPGFKTTEFWLTLAAMLVSMLFAAGVFGEQATMYKVLEVCAAVLAGLGYTVTRGAVKKASKPPE